ncbi:LamG-like jellyroll fold domain-containing protein [Marinihelvus fidelis]|uniref:LamG-like jellyroll fold domain-containing protein n=1 Tax=Marinihelvus fidelis TaxID=2613842 RepID=UPI00177CD16C|nr:LamG-like jellyroll fold domain-containing protein [Marinihelvus fidelis]
MNLPTDNLVPNVPGLSAIGVAEDTIRLTVTSAYPTEVQVSEDGTTWAALTTLAANPDDYDHVIDGSPDDPYWADVALLLKAEGADGGTDIVDRSSHGHALTLNGSVEVDTGRTRNGDASILFGGTTSDYISGPADSSFIVGTDDYTFECFYYQDSYVGNQPPTYLFATNPSGWAANFHGIMAGHSNESNNFVDFTYNYSNTNPIVEDTRPSEDAWHHAAITREGDVFRLFIDGVLENSRTWAGSVDGGVAGALDLVGRRLDGNIEDLRFTTGVARYTAAFTPPDEPFEFEGSPPYTRHYRARAVNGGVYSDWSGVVEVVTAHEYADFEAAEAEGASAGGWANGAIVIASDTGLHWKYFSVLEKVGHSGLIHRYPFNDAYEITEADAREWVSENTDPDSWGWTETSTGSQGADYELDTDGGESRIRSPSTNYANGLRLDSPETLTSTDVETFAIIDGIRSVNISATLSGYNFGPVLQAYSDGSNVFVLNLWRNMSVADGSAMWGAYGPSSWNATSFPAGSNSRMWLYLKDGKGVVWQDDDDTPSEVVPFEGSSGTQTFARFDARSQRTGDLYVGYHLHGAMTTE